MVDGQRIHRVIGRGSDGTTRSQCESFIEKARTDAREGRLSLPRARKTHLAFANAAEDYLKRLEDTGGKNLKVKRRHVRSRLGPFFGNQRLNAITTFTVERYKKRRKQAGAATGTVNRELATLSHIFGKAVEWKWIGARPCKIPKEVEERGRIVVLSDEEADALLRAAVADQDAYCWLFVMFGLNTAMRHDEILRARFDQLDMGNLRLHIPQAKAGVREQPITPELAEVLAKEQEMADDPDGWIFPTARPKLSELGRRTNMSRPFKRAAIRAGLDPAKVTPHVMRHTAITNLVQSGVDLPTIQKISGHKTLSMVLKYTHVHDPHIDRAVRMLGRKIPGPETTENAGTVTRKLHPGPKKRRRAAGPKRRNNVVKLGTCDLEARAGIEPTYEDLQSSA